MRVSATTRASSSMPAPGSPRRLPSLASLATVAASASLLVAFALYNGFPVMYNDAAVYLTAGMELRPPPDRPLTYGVFLRLAGLGRTLWGGVAVQAVLVAALVHLSIARLTPTHEPRRLTILAVAVLVPTTALSYTVSTPIADAFTPILILALALLAADPGFRPATRAALAVLAVVAQAMHYSHLLLVALLAGSTGLASAWRALRGLGPVLPSPRLKMLAAVALAPWLILPTLNLASGDRFRLSAGSHVFILGKLSGFRVLKPYLDAHCATADFRLCRYRDRLPFEREGGRRATESFLWAPDSPVNLEGGWHANESEYRSVIRGILGDSVLRRRVAAGVARDIAMILFELGVERFEPNAPGGYVHDLLRRHLPHDAAGFVGAEQTRAWPDLDFDEWGGLQQLVVAGAFFSLLARLHDRRLVPLDRARSTFGAVVVGGLLANAVVAGTLAVVVPRYNMRVVWLVPLLALVLSAERLEARDGPVGERLRAAARLMNAGPGEPHDERRPLGRLAAAGLAALAVAIVGLYWAWVRPYPPGMDPANWLVLGQMMLGREHQTVGYPPHVFPPLVPLLLAVGEKAVGPLLAISVVAALAVLATVAAVFHVAAAQGGPASAGTAAVLFTLSFPVAEAVAAGSYPQLFAFALGILALERCAAYLREPTRRALAQGAATLVAAALVHHAYYLVSVYALGLGLLLWRPATLPFREWGRRAVRVAAVAAASAVAFMPTLGAMIAGGYDPPVNAVSLSAVEALRHMFRPPRIIWIVVVGAGAAWLLASLRRPCGRTEDVGLALLAAGGTLFAATHEPRLLAPLLLGGLLGAVVAVERVRSGASSALARQVSGVALAGAIVLSVSCLREMAPLFRWFQVLDAPYLDAVEWVDARSVQGTVLVNNAPGGEPVGWFFSPLTRARVRAGCDPRWLAFPRQFETSALVARVFSMRDWGSAAAAAREAGVELLVTRKQDLPFWPAWADAAGPEVVYQNGSFAVFATAPARPGPR